MDCGGKDDDNASKLKEIANARHDHIYIKSDGSIDDGFEIVSHPMTLDYHQHDMDWEAVLHEAIKMGYRSHQTSTCGLHIHVNSLYYQRFSKVRQGSLRILGFPIAIHWLVLDFDICGVADLDFLLSEYPADTIETVLHNDCGSAFQSMPCSWISC